MKLLAAIAGVLLVLGVALLVPSIREPLFEGVGLDRPPSHERGADASLKTIFVAQRDFRENDRDGNGVRDYWRGDLAGLYTLMPKGSGEPIKLIELSVAAADDRATPDIGRYCLRGPKAGYGYRALRFQDEPAPDPQRFAAACFPSDYPRSGRFTYIIREDGLLWRKDRGRAGGIEIYPPDPPKEGWRRLE